jgi:hypothetical protein
MKGSKESHAIVPFNIWVYASSSVIYVCFYVLLVITYKLYNMLFAQTFSSPMVLVISILWPKRVCPFFSGDQGEAYSHQRETPKLSSSGCAS